MARDALVRTKIVHGDNVAGPQRLEDIPAFILIVLLPIAHTGLVRGSSTTTLSREPENGEGDMAKKKLEYLLRTYMADGLSVPRRPGARWPRSKRA